MSIKKKRIRCSCSCTTSTHHSSSSTTVQTLFFACNSFFKSPNFVSLPSDVNMIHFLLDKMTLEDVGLHSDQLFFKSKTTSNGTPRITYATVYQSSNFSVSNELIDIYIYIYMYLKFSVHDQEIFIDHFLQMCLFFLPPGAVIPLHDHPGMTVFTKILFGSMHIKSYDWTDSVESSDHLPLAKIVVDSVFTAPCKSSILYPNAGGNIHCFTAITPCVFLDVLGPSFLGGRDCSYYKEHPSSSSSSSSDTDEVKEDNQNCWLEEIDVPKDLFRGVEYLGPKIIDA
ncbi:putative cysteamine dioxygenase [Dioscorea sansibarensis]